MLELGDASRAVAQAGFGVGGGCGSGERGGEEGRGEGCCREGSRGSGEAAEQRGWGAGRQEAGGVEGGGHLTRESGTVRGSMGIQASGEDVNLGKMGETIGFNWTGGRVESRVLLGPGE